LKEQEEIVKARAFVGQLVSEEAQEKIDTLRRERPRAEEQSRRLIAL
jgi:hypothetical protein